jgi:hypothetical protein
MSLSAFIALREAGHETIASHGGNPNMGASWLTISAFFGPSAARLAQIRDPVVQLPATFRNQFAQIRNVELVPIHSTELHRSITILMKPDVENQVTA